MRIHRKDKRRVRDPSLRIRVPSPARLSSEESSSFDQGGRGGKREGPDDFPEGARFPPSFEQRVTSQRITSSSQTRLSPAPDPAFLRTAAGKSRAALRGACARSPRR